MSFSSRVKEELSEQISSARHCQLAELMALFEMCGRIKAYSRGRADIIFQTENLYVARKIFTLLKKTFIINADVLQRAGNKSHRAIYLIVVRKEEEFKRVFEALKLRMSHEDRFALLLRQFCCKRSYIRGAFLIAGSISDPNRSYHFEISCDNLALAEMLQSTINSLELEEPLDSKIVQRKKYYVVYIKDGSQIVDLLNIMGAHVSLMEMENLRVVKEMRNSVNRKVNCETANLNKTVSAAVRQIEDIRYIRDCGRINSLPEALMEMATIRLEYPEASLKELGELLNPPVGKSGVNHRLRKLSQIAEELRGV